MTNPVLPQAPDVEIVERPTVFQGYFHIDRYRLRHKLFNGGMSGEMTREIFERGHAVAVLPYDPILDKVVLIEQFRPGALAAGWHPWVIEPIAGIIEPNETIEQVVHRESREEAGLTVLDVMPIYHYLTSPGGTSETCALFCGRVDSRDAGGIHGLESDQEDIRVMTVPFAEIASWLADGKLNVALLIIALQWLALNRDRVRDQWR